VISRLTMVWLLCSLAAVAGVFAWRSTQIKTCESSLSAQIRSDSASSESRPKTMPEVDTCKESISIAREPVWMDIVTSLGVISLMLFAGWARGDLRNWTKSRERSRGAK
jgi:hypothetical protein